MFLFLIPSFDKKRAPAMRSPVPIFGSFVCRSSSPQARAAVMMAIL